MTLIMRSERLVRQRLWALGRRHHAQRRLRLRDLHLRLAPKAVLETVPTPIRQQRRHPRRRQPTLRLRPRPARAVVIPITILRVAVYRLALRLAPRDTPRRVARGRSEGDYALHVPRRGAQRPLEGGHTAHGPPDDDGDGANAEVVEDELVHTHVVADGGWGELGAVGLVSGRV